MDKTALKTILSAHRSGRQDESDPVFAEALREIASDPELAAWFEETRGFDARMVAALEAVPAPAGLKELILLNAGAAASHVGAVSEAPRGWQRRLAPWLAMAAVFAFAFVLGRLTLPHASSPAAHSDNPGNRLALQAIAYTDKMPALQFVCFDAAEVARWVDKRSVAMQMGKLIEKPMASMQMIGSSTTQWDGKPVVMVALQNHQQMAMLYFVRAADFPEIAGRADEIMEKDGYAAQTSHSGGCVCVLTTKGTRANLDFPMPR